MTSVRIAVMVALALHAAPAAAAPGGSHEHHVERSTIDIGTATATDRRPRDAEPTPPEHTAADVAGAPVPGDESGRVDGGDRGDSVPRRIGRGILVLPRGIFAVVFSPLRAGVWAMERYQLKERTRRIFFNDTGTIGLYPTARLESGFGLDVGARFVHRDLFGADEHLSLNAGTGGRYQQVYQASFRTGDRLGERLALHLHAEYERRPKDVYYGVGNDDAGVEARFRQRLARLASVLDVRVHRALRARMSGSIKDVDFARSAYGMPIDEMYPDALIGFSGIRHGYAELELRWDTRRAASEWQPRAIHSAGSLVAAYAGRVAALDGGTDFWRYGADLQHFIAVGDGPRVLSGRIHAEAVDEARDEIAFTELPRLGGKTYLRGYPLDRFRDRVAGLASIEYQWDLSRGASASVFVDAGRVAPSVPDLDLDGVRIGYGVALEGYTDHSFLIRAMLASSVDGGVFLDIAFDPVFDLDARVDRR